MFIHITKVLKLGDITSLKAYNFAIALMQKKHHYDAKDTKISYLWHRNYAFIYSNNTKINTKNYNR